MKIQTKPKEFSMSVYWLVLINEVNLVPDIIYGFVIISWLKVHDDVWIFMACQILT